MYANTLLAFHHQWDVDGKQMEMVSVDIHTFNEEQGTGVAKIRKALKDTKNVDAYCSDDRNIYCAAEHRPDPIRCGKKLFIVRNPWDVVLSYAECISKVDKKERNLDRNVEDVVRQYVFNGPNFTGHFKETWHQFVSRMPDGVTIKFEDMVADQVGTVKRALSELGCEVNQVRNPLTIEQCRRKSNIWYNVGIVGR